MNNRHQFMSLVAGGIAACLIAATWLIGRASAPRDETSTAASASRLTVRSAVVRREQWPTTIEAFGNVAPWEEVTVSAQVEGQALVELLANVGDHVRKGQVLARFDTEKLGAEVMRLRAEVAQARAEVGQANSERDRALQLAEMGAVSKQEVVQRVTAAEVAVARLSAARAQLAARELDLRRANVVASDDGTISGRNAQAGMVGSSGLELFRIIRRDRLEWRGEMTAVQLSRVAPGQQVILSLPDGKTAEARVRHLAPSMNTQTRLAIVYADIEPGGRARAGTYVNGRIVLGQSPALVVPASSLVVRDGYSFAFEVAAVGEQRRVRKRQVETGRRVGTDVEILSGLSEGAHVVVQGAGFLDDGDLVRVVADKPARPSAPSRPAIEGIFQGAEHGSSAVSGAVAGEAARESAPSRPAIEGFFEGAEHGSSAASGWGMGLQ